MVPTRTDLLPVEWHSYVVGQLSSHRQDDALRILHVVNVHHRLKNTTAGALVNRYTVHRY